MSDEGQDVLVLTSHDINDSSNIASCGQSTNVLNKLLTGTNSSGASVPSTCILYIPGFRKIEPKPGSELRSDEVMDEKESNVREGRHASSGRLLEINATKRGVKTCPVCFNKIGYRAKQCKHCSPSKVRNPRKPRQPAISTLINKKNNTTIKSESPETTTRLHRPVSSEAEQEHSKRLEESKLTQDEPCTTTVGEQPVLSSPPVLTQRVQLVMPENEQGSESLTPQADQPVLEGVLQEGDQEDTLVLNELRGTQYEEVGHITNYEDKIQQKNVLNEVIVGNVAEVSTNGDSIVQKTSEEVVVTTETQDIVNEVFISSKLTQNNTSIATTASKYSLQDLICGLLAQNQGTIPGGNPVEMTKNQESSTGTASVAVQTDSTKHGTAGKSLNVRDDGVELSNSCIDSNQEKSASAENSYDANSVALFLGEMAQRNGKKRRVSSLSKVPDNETKVVTLMPGSIQKWNMLTSGEAKRAKFRKIQPKDIAYVSECEVPVCEEEKEEIGELRGDSQCRIMNGNATRRGVMLCTKCLKMIGCRSKICKHCKNPVTDSPCRETSHRVIKQAVQLCLPEELSIQMFSVRKCKTGPELRCFVQFENKHGETSNTRKTCQSKYTCDYPLCVTAKELVNSASDYVCEHARICCVPTNVLKAKLPILDPDKITEMPFGKDLKDMVRLLHTQCSSKNIPLVQHVSYKTLAVVEQFNSNPSDSLGKEVASFVHVRFEKVKGDGCFQWQVYCSGRSCMGWNFISNDSPACLMKTCGCVHFAAALWAIASDNALLKGLREFFDAFVQQGKVGNN